MKERYPYIIGNDIAEFRYRVDTIAVGRRKTLRYNRMVFRMVKAIKEFSNGKVNQGHIRY